MDHARVSSITILKTECNALHQKTGFWSSDMSFVKWKVTSPVFEGRSTACRKHPVLLPFGWEEGEESSTVVEIGPWVSLFCLVGIPGVFIPGNVGVSSLFSYQEAKIAMRNLFFVFVFPQSRNPLRTRGRKGKIRGGHTHIKSHLISYF